MRSDSTGNTLLLEQDKSADEIQKRHRVKMIAQYGEEDWRKKQEDDLKRVQAKLKEMESSKPKTVPRIEKKPPINAEPYVESNTTDKTQMRASEEVKKQGVSIEEGSNKPDVVEDEMIESEPKSDRKELKPVDYKGNYLGSKKAIKDKIFNKSRGSKSLQNATTLLFYLIQHSAWKDKNDKHHTYKNWYLKKRLIVASRSQEQMALDLGVSVSTIKRWLDDLERDKLIERAIEGRENVYILGKVIGDTELFFYERDRVQK
jgi:hypothetical protein